MDGKKLIILWYYLPSLKYLDIEYLHANEVSCKNRWIEKSNFNMIWKKVKCNLLFLCLNFLEYRQNTNQRVSKKRFIMLNLSKDWGAFPPLEAYYFSKESFLQKKITVLRNKHNLVIDDMLFYIQFYLLENHYVFIVKVLWELINWRKSFLYVSVSHLAHNLLYKGSDCS